MGVQKAGGGSFSKALCIFPNPIYMPRLHLLGWGWLANTDRAPSSVPFCLGPSLSPTPLSP